MENSEQLNEDKQEKFSLNLIRKAVLALFAASMMPPIIPVVIGLVVIIPALFSGGKIQEDGNWTPFIGMILLIFIASSLHVTILGILTLIIGWYFKSISWQTSLIASFIIGALPTAIFLWPLKYPQLQTTSSRWNGERMVQTMIGGVPTVTGWTDWVSAFIVMGLFGVSGGITFWLIWRESKKPTSHKQVT